MCGVCARADIIPQWPGPPTTAWPAGDGAPRWFAASCSGLWSVALDASRHALQQTAVLQSCYLVSTHIHA